MRATRTNLMGASAITIMDAINDPQLFAPWFRDRQTWVAWFCFLKALFGLGLFTNQAERELFKQCTGSDHPPTEQPTEGWLICGRRAGKSFILALIAVYLAVFRNYEPFLAPGERATIVVIAADRKQARIIFRYIKALLSQIPLLTHLIERETQEALDLSNKVTVEVHSASYRRSRGYAVAAALLDEVAFWSTDEGSAEPDVEIINALRPGMATIPGAFLLCASSPYARKGALWQAFAKHHGKSGPVLVWKAPTRTMNPTVPQSVIDAATEDDPASAAAEYGAEFRTDVETFIAREVVAAATPPGRHELPPISGIQYAAFTDPSGGSSDSFTAAVGHREKDGRIILDAVRERRPPFAPDAVTSDLALLFKTYRIREVTGDRYGGEFPRERFRTHGIEYKLSDRSKSDLYRDALPLLNSGRVELLDVPRLGAQLCGLERRTARGGRDSIDHAPGQMDDVANSTCGLIAMLAAKQGPIVISDRVLAQSAIPVPRVRSVQRAHFR